MPYTYYKWYINSNYLKYIMLNNRVIAEVYAN